MPELLEKQALLEGAGYAYDFDRMIYVSRQARKAFSLEYVEDHPLADLQRAVQTPRRGKWQFFFNTPPSPGAQEALAEALGA